MNQSLVSLKLSESVVGIQIRSRGTKKALEDNEEEQAEIEVKCCAVSAVIDFIPSSFFV